MHRNSPNLSLHLILRACRPSVQVSFSVKIDIPGVQKEVDAVNNWGELGLWDYVVVKDLTRIEDVLERYTRK